MTPKPVRVTCGPARTNGTVSRIVELSDGSGRVETWGADGWVPGGADIRSVMMG